LAAALRKVIRNDEDEGVEDGDTTATATVDLRVFAGGSVFYPASMSMSLVPQQGLVVVTRLYDGRP